MLWTQGSFILYFVSLGVGGHIATRAPFNSFHGISLLGAFPKATCGVVAASARRDHVLAKISSLHALRTSLTSSTAAFRYRRYGCRRRLSRLRRLRSGGMHTFSRTSAAHAGSVGSPRLDSCQSRWRREQTKGSSPRAAEVSSLLEASAGTLREYDVLAPFGRRPLEMGRPHHSGEARASVRLLAGSRQSAQRTQGWWSTLWTAKRGRAPPPKDAAPLTP